MKQFKSVVLLLLLVSVQIFATAKAPKNNPVFVLVHGAWHGGWCWSDVKQNFIDKGYKVFTPTLTGLGERKHLVSEKVNLDTHIDDIVHLIEMEDLHDVYLVGHSYAGAVIAGVADRIPERLSKLIFLDAMIVENGQSAISLQPDGVQQLQLKNIKRKENFEPFDVALFGVTDAVVATSVKKRLTPQPFNTFAQPLKLKHKYGNGLPLVYIACTRPQLPIMKEMSDKVQADKNLSWQHIELRTGHDAMITAPNELADVFEGLIN
ncbi:alpha/beta hydrolase [Olivibacter sp. LS-1]|uniref:alpha/beta hydrolase n=1 Tax=Olivibacter sp. LS-1 TaxID=2592345 RepID=UPI0011EB1F76|nr:alpha/beta hydrolase family protein [Olivibacter sp. LS-1]QEK99517.1 alpha/beta hydrolase [Olivibacter sp. LS-1]